MGNVEIIDFGWEQLQKELKLLHRVKSKVGLPTGGDVGSGEALTMSEVATVGAVHEFGAPNKNIPERSWLRASYDENKGDLDRVKTREYNRLLEGKQTAIVAIGRVGEWLAAKVKAKIRKGPFEPLAATTLARKAPKTKPLIDTGQMIQSVTHVEVVE